jgi:sugar lactone lactonase YvrE
MKTVHNILRWSICVILCMAPCGHALEAVVSVAGTGVAGDSGDGGPALSAQLRNPIDLAVDASGNIFIADYNNHRIRRVDAATGNISTFAGSTQGFGGDGGQATAAQLNFPDCVVLDSKGNLIISDQFNNRIRMVASDGTISTLVGDGTFGGGGDGGPAAAAQLAHPFGMAVDKDDNIYISDINNHSIRKFDRASGKISKFAGGNGSGFTGDGGAASAAQISFPGGPMSIDAGGSLYFCDTGNARIRKIDASGVITTVAGNGQEDFSGDGGPATSAAIKLREGGGIGGCVTVDKAGNIFIADSNNLRIRKVDTNGIITTVAGTGTFGFNGDFQEATKAQLSVIGMRFDSAGNLLFADIGNSLIRKLVFNSSRQFKLQSITPNTGGNSGPVTAIVRGSGIVDGATVKLVRAGQPDIVGQFTRVALLGLGVTTTFDLTGAAVGAADVVVTNPDGSTTTLAGGFNIAETVAPKLFISVVGRDKIRGGKDQLYSFVCENRGNVDVYAVPLLITVPSFAKLTPNFTLATLPQPAGTPIDYSQVPLGIEQTDHTLVPIIIPALFAGQARSVSFKLNVPDTFALAHVKFSLRAVLGEPMLDAATVLQSVHPTAGAALPGGPGGCVNDMLGLVFDCAGIFFPPLACEEEVGKFGLDALTSITAVAFTPGATAGDINGAFSGIAAGAAQTLLNCGLKISPVVGNAISIGLCALDALAVAKDCFNQPVPDLTPGNLVQQTIEAIVSGDPNDKSGPAGISDSHYISNTEPLRYAIVFENEPTATAAAQQIIVTDILDPATMDLSTLALGPIYFNTTVVTPPPGSSSFTQDVDLRPTQNLIVRITAGLDSAQPSMLKWTFTSLDPATGNLTEDPTAGLLPPNVNSPEGDGGVSFTVQQKAGNVALTVISNTARIVFDQNSPIDTPTFQNTIANFSTDVNISKIQVKLDFSPKKLDSLSFDGDLPTALKNFKGEQMIVTVDGLARTFTFDDKGNSTPKSKTESARIKAGKTNRAKFSVKLNKESLQNFLVSLNNDTLKSPKTANRQLSVLIFFDGTILQKNVSIAYGATKDKRGTAKVAAIPK